MTDLKEIESNLNSLLDKYADADQIDQKKMNDWKKLIIQEIKKKAVSENPAVKSLIFTLNRDISRINKALLREEKMSEETRAVLFSRRSWCEEQLKPFTLNSQAMESLDREIKKALDAKI